MNNITPMTPNRPAADMPIAGVAGGELTLDEKIPQGLGMFHSLYALWDTSVHAGAVKVAVTTRDSNNKMIPVVFAAPGLPVRVSGNGIATSGKDFLGKDIVSTSDVTIIAHFGEVGA